MNKIILGFLIVLLFGCGQKSAYNDYEVNEIKIKIDRRITDDKKKKIIWTVEHDLSPAGAFYIKNLTEITYDSLLFSYLLTLHSHDSISQYKLHLMKAYTELLSSNILDKRPVHMYAPFNGQYIEYDTTVLKKHVGYVFELGRLKLETKDAGEYLNSRVAKLLEKSLRQVKFDGPLMGTLKSDSAVYTVDFILDPSKQNPIQFRDSIAAIDPYYKFLILDENDLFVHLKDSTGKILTSVHFP